jgi:hypothetical protein
MRPVTVSVVVDRPVEEVFDFLDVLANHESFTDHFLKDWRLSGPPTGVGAQVKLRAEAMGRSEEVELEVTEAQRPTFLRERTIGAGGKRVTVGTYRLEPAGEHSTNVNFELAYEQAPFAERLAAPISRAWLRKANASAMERLREQLAREPEPEPAPAA